MVQAPHAYRRRAAACRRQTLPAAGTPVRLQRVRQEATVAVVTVAYRSGEVLPRFLHSLAGATARRVHVVIADNAAGEPGAVDPSLASPDGRLRLEVIGTGGNLGYGRAANVGVARTDAPFVVIANPDIEWHPGSLDALLDAASRWPRGGGFGPVICTPEGRVYPSARDLPSLGRGVGHALFGWWWPDNPWTASYRRENEPPVERTAGWLSGSCLVLRRVAFDAVGGFSPSYFMYFEDVDLGERLGRAGWQNVYVPQAVVTHLGGHSAAQVSARMATEHHASAYRYLAGRYRGWRYAPVRGALAVGLAARAGLARRVRSLAGGAVLGRGDGRGTRRGEGGS